MPSGDNKCDRCGQWAGDGHVCETGNGEAGGVTLTTPDDPPDALSVLPEIWERADDGGPNGAIAQAAMDAYDDSNPRDVVGVRLVPARYSAERSLDAAALTVADIMVAAVRERHGCAGSESQRLQARSDAARRTARRMQVAASARALQHLASTGYDEVVFVDTGPLRGLQPTRLANEHTRVSAFLAHDSMELGPSMDALADSPRDWEAFATVDSDSDGDTEVHLDLVEYRAWAEDGGFEAWAATDNFHPDHGHG